MAVFHGPSGLPEDRVVNVFHFTGSAVDSALHPIVSD
jgi:hypothetical protein